MHALTDFFDIGPVLFCVRSREDSLLVSRTTDSLLDTSRGASVRRLLTKNDQKKFHLKLDIPTVTNTGLPRGATAAAAGLEPRLLI